jgi:hypothetical protein
VRLALAGGGNRWHFPALKLEEITMGKAPVAFALLLTLVPCAGWAQNVPPSLMHVEQLVVPAFDRADLAAEDEQRALSGLPPRFAIPLDTLITPATDGTWTDLDADTRLWQLRITAAGALSLNFGFTGFALPKGAELRISAANGESFIGPFTDSDNAAHGELWTPVIITDDAVLELRVPRAAIDQLVLSLTAINVGYRFFGESAAERSGWCNIDVVCPEGALWQPQIKSVAAISTGGSIFCTGFLVNNTAQDRKPYFMTANHCGIGQGNAASLVVYWNYQSPTCGQHGGGSLAQYHTGAYFRASYGSSDFTLVELDSAPSTAADVWFAGWDRTTTDPASAVAIHHPQGDEKSISFEYQSCTTTSYLGSSSPGDGTHIRVTDWDLGTTEPGSSGSPLFNQEQRVVGQLHGGYAACGNDLSDWYGRFSRSWTGGGSNTSRLSNWLDPLNTGQLVIDALPNNGLMEVTPPGDLDASGDPGGPFLPGSIIYYVHNPGPITVSYSVTCAATWLSISNASGSLPVGETAEVEVYINASAIELPVGTHTTSVEFTNNTTGGGNTSRTATLQIGFAAMAYEWNLDTNPGWSTQDLWGWGVPLGGGGERGVPDPTAGHTGTKVYGYNLAGDYANFMTERALTTTPIDCTNLFGVSLRFWRWLGVEKGQYDHAYVRVSTDGTSWTTLWENPYTLDIADEGWEYQVIDLAGLVDNQPTVYIRWVMGATDFSVRYCGWNIDDVSLWAVSVADCNQNSSPDYLDLASGASFDDNGNGVPDECDPLLLGDLECDGDVDFGDINDFVQLLADLPGWLDAHPGCPRLHGDINGSGQVNFADINPFVKLLSDNDKSQHVRARFDHAAE